MDVIANLKNQTPEEAESLRLEFYEIFKKHLAGRDVSNERLVEMSHQFLDELKK